LGDGTSKAAVDRVLEAVLETIRASIARHESVQLIGFGTFSVTKRAARTGVNPRTKAKIRIPQKNVVKFRPGSELSGAVE
jgi:DNA-binding protein HU-beta